MDTEGWIGVSTLASPLLAEALAARKIKGLAVTGKTETENIGVEKVVRNILALPALSYLLLCGKESEGHASGDAIVNLWKNGVNEEGRIIGARGRKPILKNLERQEIEEFRRRIEVLDMKDCSDLDLIEDKMEKLAKREVAAVTDVTSTVERIQAVEKDPLKVKLDKAGYFVIYLDMKRSLIVVEHYSNENVLLHMIEGGSARDIYWTIIDRGLVTEISHGAYLGKELTRAERSMVTGETFIQDKA